MRHQLWQSKAPSVSLYDQLFLTLFQFFVFLLPVIVQYYCLFYPHLIYDILRASTHDFQAKDLTKKSRKRLAICNTFAVFIFPLTTILKFNVIYKFQNTNK